MNSAIHNGLVLGVAAVSMVIAAGTAVAGPRSYDLKEFLGPDPFAQQFWGQSVQPPAQLPASTALPTAVLEPSIEAPPAVRVPVPVSDPAVPAPALALPPPTPEVAQVGSDADLPPVPPVAAAEEEAVWAPPPINMWAVPSAGFLTSLAGRYMTGAVGLASHAEASNSGSTLNNTVSYSSGLTVQFALGYEWNPQWNLEAEFSIRRAAADKIKPRGGTAATATGNMLTTAFMANGLREIEMGWSFTPYLVVGGGLAQASAQDIDSSDVSKTSSSDWVMAWQFGGGIEYPLSPTWSLDASYRYFATTKPELTNSASANYESELAVHNFIVGTRYRF